MSLSARPGIAASYTKLRAAQKPAKGAPLYSRVVNRPLGRALAAAAHHFGLTPNAVTLVSAVFTYSAIVLLWTAPPTPVVAALITALLVLGYALDAADGQLARLRGGGSLSGEWLDHVVDSGKLATLHLGVAVMIYRWYPVPAWWVLLPLGFGAVQVIHFFGMLLTELLARVAYAQARQQPPAQGTGSTLVAALKLPTDYGILCLAFALLAQPWLFLAVYGALAAGSAGYTVLVLPVWYRRIRTIDRERLGGVGP